MDAYIANNMNSDKKKEKDFLPYHTNWSHYADAQSIIHYNMEDVNTEECIVLIKKMFSAVATTEICGGNFLNNTAKTVVQWNDEVSKQSLEPIKDMLSMKYINENKNLNIWQKEILNILKLKPKIRNIYLFKKHENYFLWILADEPSSTDIFEYSQEYVKVMSKLPDTCCDFMVFGEEEAEFYQIPDDAMKF